MIVHRPTVAASPAPPASRQRASVALFPTRRRERGFAVGMILMGIALLGVVTYAIAAGSRSSASGMTGVGRIASLTAQAGLIRQSVEHCSLNWADGAMPATPTGGLVSNLVCPGVNQNIWTGTVAAAGPLPAPPAGFNAWTYANDAQGVRISAAARLRDAHARSTAEAARRNITGDTAAPLASCVDTGSTVSLVLWIQRTGSAPAATTCP